MYQSTAVTIGPQTHINPKHKAIRGVLVQRCDETLADPGKKFLIANGLCLAVGLPPLWVDKDQVYIG